MEKDKQYKINIALTSPIRQWIKKYS
jgi:hypothetical protein